VTSRIVTGWGRSGVWRVVISVAAVLSGANAGSGSAQTVAIVGGTVYTVSGPKIEHGTVIIRDGRIVAVGGDVPVPAGATRVDATGKWVTPGIIAAETPLGLVEVGSGVDDARDTRARGRDGIAAAFTAVDGLNPASQMIPLARAGGVTSVGVVPEGGMIAGQAAFLDLVAGPASAMVLRAPVAMVAQLGHADQAGAGARGELLSRLRALFDDVRTYAQHRADYDRADARPLSASRSDLAALVPVLRGVTPLVIHADRASDIENALTLARDYHLTILISGGAEAWKVAPDLAAARVPVLTASLSNLPESFSTLGQRQDNAALLQRAGVSVVLVGTAGSEDNGQFNVRNITQEAGTAVAYGLPWEEALRAVTAAPAAAFGLADRVGTLRPGLEANVVVWSGDPFEYGTRAEHVFVRGQDYTAPTREDLLTARYKR
jgi:imidazolonepropionase-like amidohydrolase